MSSGFINPSVGNLVRANSLSEISPTGESGAAVFRVRTIAALKAATVATLSNRQTVEVLGYYTEGDGGGGLFRYSGSSALADNGGTVIAPDVGAGRWLRMCGTTASVRQFGAKGDGTDDSSKIQAAIDWAKVQSRGPAQGSLDKGTRVVFEDGSYSISALDFTDCVGLEVTGQAAWGVNLYADKQAAAGKTVMDLTRTIGCVFSGITVHGSDPGGSDPAIIPTTGWLVAESNATGDCTKNRFNNCGTTGKFSKAGFAMFGATDCIVDCCGWSNNHAAGVCFFCGTANDLGLASEYQTLPAAGSNAGDNTVIATEHHGAQSGAPTGYVFLLYGVDNFRVIGGLSDNRGPGHVLFKGTNRNVLFSGVKFYSESASAPTDIFFNSNGTVYGLTVDNPNTADNAFSQYMFNGSGAATYPGGSVRGADKSKLTGPYLYQFAAQVLVFGDVAALAAGATLYLGAGASSATAGHIAIPLPGPGVITGIIAVTNASPGGAETFTFTVVKDGADQAVTVQLTAAESIKQATAAGIRCECNAQQSLRIKAVSSGGAAVLAGMWVTVGFIPGY